jgi:iron(III) transport system permease protein
MSAELGRARPGSAPFARLNALDVTALLIALLLAVPLVSVCLSLFSGIGPTFAHLVATVLPDYVLNTLLLGALVVVGVLIIGVPAAWLTAMCDFPGKRLLEAALVLPLAAPAYVLAYAYTDLLDSYGPVQNALRAAFGWQVGEYWFPDVRSLPGAALMLVLVLYPYVYLLARTRFLSESATALEAARLLGRGPWRSFLTVSLPLARPALAAGATLALMEAFADYGTVSYFGVPVFTTGIYRAWFSFGDPTAAAQLAAFLIGFVALALCLERIARGGARYHETGRRDRRPTAFKLQPAKAAGAIVLCALPPLFGFAVPALALLHLLVQAGGPAREFWHHLMNSVTLAALAGVIATAVAIVLGFARHERPRGPVARAVDFVGLGYAAPGAVIAVGVLIPFAAFDNALDAALRSSFGVSTGLLLTGSIAALLFAYLVRFLAVALQSVNAGLARITPSVGGAARMLARGNWDALWRVHMPMIAPSALTAALIVFVDVMKELPATLMLRPFNFDTLAVAAYNYAADERLGFAAAPSLAIVVVGIIPCILLIRGIAAAAHGRETTPAPLP